MRYISTRGEAPTASLKETLLQGLAPDGGLYLPETLPTFSPEEIASLRGKSYEAMAETILSPFLLEIFTPAEITGLIENAYQSFRHPRRVGLSSLKLEAFLPTNHAKPPTPPTATTHATLTLSELFHGPTYAFKDFALQLLAQTLGAVFRREQKRFTVLGATSGDTGSAAIAAFQNVPGAEVVILHPHEGTSLLQRKQMTTTGSPNVRNLAVEGSFDDCQRLVKACFRDSDFRKALGGELIAVNSINWLRVLAQTVYYFFSALHGAVASSNTTTNHNHPSQHSDPHTHTNEVSFAVPTGNFGDVFAGTLAQRMGLPIKTLIVATNANNILDEFFRHNRYTPQNLKKTFSPSMDIATASNFERLLYYALDGDQAALCGAMADLQTTGTLSLPPHAFARAKKSFYSTSTSNAQTLETLSAAYRSSGTIIDPHTAVGVAGAIDYITATTANEAIIVLATAHPAKFQEAFASIKETIPSDLSPLHELDSLLKREEVFKILPNDLSALQRELLPSNA